MNEAPEKSSRRAFDTYSKQLLIVLSAATLRLAFDSLGGAEGLESLKWPLLALAVASSIYVVSRLVRASRAKSALRSETADAFVAHASRALSAPRAASASAVVAGLFGDRARADSILASVEWTALEAEERAERLFAEAMLHVLDGDAEEGFAVARRAAAAVDLSEEDDEEETGSSAEIAHRARLALHRLLVFGPTKATLRLLEDGRARLRDLDRVLASFGLALAYEAEGRTEEAAWMRAWVHANAPHARALLACVDATLVTD